MNKKNNIKLTKWIAIILVILLILSIPLHYKVIESSAITNSKGMVDVQLIYGVVTIKDDLSEVPAYTPLRDIGKLNFVNSDSNQKPVLKRLYIAPFIRFKSINRSNMEDFRKNIYMYTLECDYNKLLFSNGLN